MVNFVKSISCFSQCEGVVCIPWSFLQQRNASTQMRSHVISFSGKTSRVSREKRASWQKMYSQDDKILEFTLHSTQLLLAFGSQLEGVMIQGWTLKPNKIKQGRAEKHWWCRDNVHLLPGVIVSVPRPPCLQPRGHRSARACLSPFREVWWRQL